MAQPPPDFQPQSGALPRTIVPSAPAVDSITQIQIMLNNLLSQVREGFHFMLEGAPPLSLEGEYVQQPSELMDYYRRFRDQFVQAWREGKNLRKGAQLGKIGEDDADEATRDPNKDLDDEEDELADMVKETYDPPAMNAEAVDVVLRDTLFRAQRIASLHESIRAMIPELPSVYLTDENGEEQYVREPHKSTLVSKRLEYWQAANDAIEPLVEQHTTALSRCVEEIRAATLQVAHDTLNQHEQFG